MNTDTTTATSGDRKTVIVTGTSSGIDVIMIEPGAVTSKFVANAGLATLSAPNSSTLTAHA